jgi:hypothetical protein
LGVLLFALVRPPVTQQSEGSRACGFALSGAFAKTTISGPDEIVSPVHIVEQPDSPVEILAIDFKDSWVAVANERETHKLLCTLKFRNRSDQSIRKVGIRIRVATADGGGGWEYVGPQTGLAAGKELEEGNACGVRRQWGAHLVIVSAFLCSLIRST